MATPPRKRGIMEKRRDDISRVGQMTVKPHEYCGYVLLSHAVDVSAAEATVDIDFPVVFTEKPVFTYGAELDSNNRAVAGSYPTLTAVVVNWNTVGEIIGATDGRFTGASVAVVSTGVAGQSIWLHYSFKGKAMRNPLTQINGPI